MPLADPAACDHPNFDFDMQVSAIRSEDGGPVRTRLLTIKTKCQLCGKQFWYPGLPIGVDYTRPMTDVTGFELSVPLVPANRQLDPSAKMVGYIVRGDDTIKGRLP